MNLSLTNDLAFTDIFGNPKNQKYREYLLECLMNEEIKDLKQITLEKTISKEHLKDKRNRLDLVFEKNEKIINLEMYTAFNKNTLKKSAFYIVSTLNQELKKGSSYKNLKKMIQINFVSKLKGIELKSECQTILTNYPLTEVCECLIIRLDLIDNVDYNNVINLKLLQFLKFMKADSYEKRKEIAKGCEILMELNETVSEYFKDPDFLKNFDFLKNREEIKYNDGIDEGILIGKNEGNRKFAKYLESTGKSMEEISNTMELPISKIKELLEM